MGKRRRYARNGLISRRSAQRILRPYLHLLGEAMDGAVKDWRALGDTAEGAAARSKIRSGTKASNIHDFIKHEVLRRTDGVGGMTSNLHGQLLTARFADGELNMSFGKLPDRNRRPKSANKFRIWRQAEALDALPGTNRTTWLHCFYELDAAGSQLRRVVIRCMLFGRPQWTIEVPLPLAAPLAPVVVIATDDIPGVRLTPTLDDALSEMAESNEGRS